MAGRGIGVSAGEETGITELGSRDLFNAQGNPPVSIFQYDAQFGLLLLVNQACKEEKGRAHITAPGPGRCIHDAVAVAHHAIFATGNGGDLPLAKTEIP